MIHHGSFLLCLGLGVWVSAWACIVTWGHVGELAARIGWWSWVVLALLGLSWTLCLKTYFSFLRDWICGDWNDCSGWPLRLLLYCLVGGIALNLFFLQPFDLIRSVTTLGLVFGAHALLLMSRRKLERAIPASLLRGLDVALFYICILVIGAEVGLRSLSVLRPSVLLARPDERVERAVEAGRYAPGTIHLGFPVNSSGHYDVDFAPRESGQDLVLAIGDSYSYGVVPHYFHFTTVAERLLPGVQIYNMGIPRTGPQEYLHLLLTEGLPLQPDVIVVNLYLGNDVIPPPRLPQQQSGLRQWLDRDNILLYQVPRRLRILAEERRGSVSDPFAESEESGVGGTIIHSRRRLLRTFPWLREPSLERPTWTEERFLEIELSRARRIAEQSTSDYLRRFEVLKQIERAAGSTPVLFFVIPDEFQLEDALWAEIEAVSDQPLDRHKAHRLLLDWLEREGMPYLDLLPILAEIPPLEDGDRHLYKLRDTHFNARGNRVAGRALAEFVRPYLPERTDR